MLTPLVHPSSQLAKAKTGQRGFPVSGKMQQRQMGKGHAMGMMDGWINGWKM